MGDVLGRGSEIFTVATFGDDLLVFAQGQLVLIKTGLKMNV